uniref:Tyrosine--tRNA ligase n=1 Tax=Oryza glaberrima TaxID=4538 RepID=I1PR01_ORYGL
MEMGFDEKFALLRSIAEECICEDELRVLLKKKPNPICYVWFEPTSMMGIEQGIMKTIYVNKMVRAGCTVKILIADWFLQRNPRFTCNLNKIQAIIRYNIMMWKAVGMHHDKVEIIWFSDELNHHAVDYWPLAMDVSRKYTMKRMASYCKYVEPYGPGILPAAQIIYPCMLVSAVLCHKICINFSAHCIPYVDDIEEKISCAFCPSRVVACNPCLEYIKSVVLPWFGKFEVVQKEGNGSNKTYSSMKELIADYESGDLDSFDVKLALGKAINGILELVSEFFRSNEEAQAQIVPHRLQDEIGADIQKIQLQNEEMSGHVASTCQGISEKKKITFPSLSPMTEVATGGAADEKGAAHVRGCRPTRGEERRAYTGGGRRG